MEENANLGLNSRNSLSYAVVVPTRQEILLPILHNHHHPHLSPSPASVTGTDFELVSLKSPVGSYTSLKDLLPTSPSSILSPTPAAASAAVSTYSCGSGYEISIRNRLVKQAAWAYLQPAVSSSPSSSSGGLCFFCDFLRPMVAGFRQFVFETTTRVYDSLVDALWLILCR